MAKVFTGDNPVPTTIARVGQFTRIAGVRCIVTGVTHTAGIRRVTAESPDGMLLLELLDKSKRAKRNGTRGWYGIGQFCNGQRIAYSVGTRTGCSV